MVVLNSESTYFVVNREDEVLIKLIGLVNGKLKVFDTPELPYFFVNKPDEAKLILNDAQKLGVVDIIDDGLRSGDEIKEPVAKVVVNAPNIVPNVRDFYKMRGFRTFEDNIVYIRRLFIDNLLKIQYNDYVFFDIETDSSLGFPKEYGRYPFLSISVWHSKGKWNKWFYVKDYDSEKDMLSDFIKFLMDKQVGLVVGWNVGFDYNHVKERLRYLGMFDEYRYWKIVSSLDLMEQYKARKPGLGSYSLHNVSIEEGFKVKEMTKLPHEMSRQELYDYNMYDSELLMLINNRYDLVETAIEIAHSMNLPMSAAMSTVARLEAQMFRRLRQLGYVGVRREGERKRYQGAIVLEGIPGLHDNVVVFDYESLYPNTIINKNIDIKGFNGEVFPYVVKQALEERLHHKRMWKELTVKISELKEQYEKTGDETIKKEIEKLKHDAVVQKLKSDAKKIVVNGFYGANANVYYYFFDPDVASAITAGGREMLMKSKKFIEDNYKLKVIYGDSVRGDSEIYLVWDGIIYPIKIKNLFGGKPDVVDNGREYKFLRGVYTPVIDVRTGDVDVGEIKYVMRHYVEKRMYRIECNGRFVDVTEDHSVIVNRNGNFMEVKPADVVDGDYIILMNVDFNSGTIIAEMCNDYNIVDLGIVREYVYDIEVEKYHNFFANGILVHNTDSIFVELGDNFGEMDKEKILEVSKFIAADLNEYVKPWKMDVDKIIKRIIFLADKKGNFIKKRYAYVDFDGNIKIKGLETVKGDWPKITKWLQRRVIEMILLENKSRSEIMKFIKQVKKDLYNGKYDEWLILAKNLSRDVDEYDQSRKLPEHVEAWVKADKMGTPFEMRQVTYVFTVDQGVMPVLKLSDVKKYRIDYDYYWKHRIEGPVMRVVDSVYPPNRLITDWLKFKK